MGYKAKNIRGKMRHNSLRKSNIPRLDTNIDVFFKKEATFRGSLSPEDRATVSWDYIS